MRLPFDPLKEERLQVVYRTVDGKEISKTCRLRFGMRELLMAEARTVIKTYTDGRGVSEVVARLTDGSIDSLFMAFQIMLGRHHEHMTNAELWEIVDADPGGVQRAVYSMFGKTLPEADPNDQPAATETTPTEETAPVGT